MPGPFKVSIFDLTVAQTEAIEQAIGLPLTRWHEAPSQASLYAHILAAATGEDIETFRAMRLRELLEAVSLEKVDPNP